MTRWLIVVVALTAASACTRDADGQKSEQGALADGRPAAGAAVPRDAENASDNTAPAGQPARGGGGERSGGQQQGGGRGGPGAPGSPGGRPPGVITLNMSDIAAVHRQTLEDGIPITGNLDPLERIQVRARIEGDLTGVFVREGQNVRAGEVLARFESSEQESGSRSAEADVVSARTELANAQWNADQTRELLKQGAVPERDAKNADQVVLAARAKLAAAEARQRSSSITVSGTRVVAPADGVIEKRLTSNGEHVSRGQALFTLVRSNVLELAAAVPARRASALAFGQKVRFSADGREFEGKVARVSPTIDPASRSVAVYIQIPNPRGELRGGTFATGNIVARTVADVLVIPAAAIRQKQETGAPYVYKIAGGTIEYADVSLGVMDEPRGLAQIMSGLGEGDRVVVGNVGLLGRGMRVQILGENLRGGGTGRSAPANGAGSNNGSGNGGRRRGAGAAANANAG